MGYYSISVKKEGGAEIISIKDIFDRTIKTKSETANGLWAITETEYDLFGKRSKKVNLTLKVTLYYGIQLNMMQ